MKTTLKTLGISALVIGAYILGTVYDIPSVIARVISTGTVITNSDDGTSATNTIPILHTTTSTSTDTTVVTLTVDQARTRLNTAIVDYDKRCDPTTGDFTIAKNDAQTLFDDTLAEAAKLPAR